MTASFDLEPGAVSLHRRGELVARARRAHEALADCVLCANRCHVDRFTEPEQGRCGLGERAMVHSWGPHLGEEDPLRGRRGSGTIFFSSCNLRCVYCQNWDTSQRRAGHEVSQEELAGIMLELAAAGCHNVNLVSPSHVVAQVLAALVTAVEAGLRLPIVYNTGAYDSPEALALLDGVVDVYMPDLKYADDEVGRRLSKVPDYVAVSRRAVREMHRQVGDLVLDRHGVARRGLLIRHLVLPGNMGGTDEVLRFLAEEISPDTYLNLMDQYRPCYRADEVPPLDRPLAAAEYREAVEAAARHGLHRLDRRHLRRG